MALPGEMMAALAQAVGQPPGRVKQVMDRLRAAALLTRKGRGRGAPNMTTRDGCRVAIALAVSHDMNAVSLQTRIAERCWATCIGKILGLEVKAGEKFGDALERLVDFRRRAVEDGTDDEEWSDLRVGFHRGGRQAQFFTYDAEISFVSETLDFTDEAARMNARLFERDLWTFVSFGIRTIDAIAETTIPRESEGPAAG